MPVTPFQQIQLALEGLHAALDRQADTLAHQAAQLTEHMRRTDAAEARVDQVEDFVVETRAYMQSLKTLGVAAAAGFGIIGTICAIVALIHTW